MKLSKSVAPKIIGCCMLGGLSGLALADSILVEQPRGGLIKLVEEGAPECGKVSWKSIRRPGTVTISGELIEIKEPKLPLAKEQWEALLTTIAGEQQEITIVSGWDKGAAGLAASLRLAYDLRSYGASAWVLNGRIGNNKTLTGCTGEFKFTGKPEVVYLNEEQFWEAYNNGKFLDARGKGAQEPPPYTWVVGSPKNGSAVDIAAFVKNDKLDTSAYNCENFRGATVVGCDSLHKSFLVVEAAKLAKCDTQPKLMPYWGLAGMSRSSRAATQLWGGDLALNAQRTGEWVNPN